MTLRFLKLPREVRRFHDGVDDLRQRYGRGTFDHQSLEQLLRCHHDILATYLNRWTLLVYNDLFAFSLDAVIGKWCSKRVDGVALHQELLGGLQNVESVEPLNRLLLLVHDARQTSCVNQLLRGDDRATDVWAKLSQDPAAATFVQRARQYIADYGFRTVQELQLEKATLEDQPWMLVDVLRNYLDRPDRSAARGAQAGAAARRAEDTLMSRWPRNWISRNLVRWVIRRTRRTIAERENLSLARSRVYAVLRRMFRAMGDRLAASGAIEQADDVFYLTLEDIEAYAGGGLVEGELAPIVERRKIRYKTYQNANPPDRIVSRGAAYLNEHTNSKRVDAWTASTLCGIPSSPGIVQGIVRVVHTPRLDERVRGEILVAPVTDPGWIFLMHAAAGLIVERGSPLSHAAIVGRELSLPTVVGVDEATHLLRNGDIVEVNGFTGRVTILQRAGVSQEPTAIPEMHGTSSQ